MKSEQINEIVSALSKAQGQMLFAKKDSDNPYFKSKYADLSAVLEVLRQPLFDNGLSFVQHVSSNDISVSVETVIYHKSGQFISGGILTVPVLKKDAQSFGLALTYARRYGLQAAFGVASDDDDGNAASQQPKQAAPVKRPVSQQPSEEIVAAFKAKVSSVSSLEALNACIPEAISLGNWAKAILADQAKSDGLVFSKENNCYVMPPHEEEI